MRTCPVRIYKRAEQGFTLIEVLVALAITALATAAATTSVLSAQRMTETATFYRAAAWEAERQQCAAYGWSDGIAPTPPPGIESETETVRDTQSTESTSWRLVVVRSSVRDRSCSLAFQGVQ